MSRRRDRAEVARNVFPKTGPRIQARDLHLPFRLLEFRAVDRRLIMRALLILQLAAESSCWTSPRVPPAAAAATSATSASAQFSVLRRSPPPRALLASFSSPFAPTRPDSTVTIRGASATDLPALANLCTDAFFGTHTFGDGPVIFAQRFAIYAKVFAQLRTAGRAVSALTSVTWLSFLIAGGGEGAGGGAWCSTIVRCLCKQEVWVFDFR